MATSLRQHYALLQYYLREKLWRHCESLCTEVVAKNDDSIFRMWQAFAQDQQGQVADALREYKACENKRDVHVAALTGLAVIYRRNKDTEGENQMERKLGDDRRTNLGAWLQAACVLWHSGDLTRARDVINMVLDADAEYRDEYTSVQLIRGWIDLTSGRGAYVDKCVSLFEKVIQAEGVNVDIDACMGKIAYLEKKNLRGAEELQNKLIVVYPDFLPAFIVKTKQLMRNEDWEQAMTVLQRVTAKDPNHVEALIINILCTLVKEAKYPQAAESLRSLRDALKIREPRNAQLYHTCAQCFSRLSGGSSEILQVTSELADQALKLQPNVSEHMSEVAFQLTLKGDFKGAHTLYKKAAAAGDGSSVPLLGLIKTTIVANKLADAWQQVTFLNELQQQRNAELLFLHSMILWRKNRDQKGSLEKLDQAVDAHKAEIASRPTGAEMYVRLNPPLVLDMAREYMQHCRTEPPEPGANKSDPNAEKARRLLETLIRHVPGSTEAQLLASQIAFIGGDVNRASTMIANCIRQDNTNSEAFLLQAKIYRHLGQNKNADNSLGEALSLDFAVKDLPQYLLLKGSILIQDGDFTNALATLETALAKVSNSPSEDTPAKGTTTAADTVTTSPQSTLGVQDHVSVYLQIAQCHLKLKDAEKANETILKAAAAFRTTTQSGRISIAQAVIVSTTDVENALQILRSVPPTSEYYIAAKARMANIYLTQRHNRRMFARCFEELVEQSPSVQSLTHLGEAYAAVQEPDKAIIAFEKARAMDPNNTDLAVRIGRTLASTHDYQRALRYYRDAVAGDSTKFSLRKDLAVLYWRLGDINNAIATLRDSDIITNSKGASTESVEQSVERVNTTLLMCKIYRSVQNSQQAVEALIQARVFQNTLVARLRSEAPEIISQQRHIAATICCELGEVYLKTHVDDKALSFYNEALKHEETNEQAMLALAKLYLNRGEIDSCEQQCNALLRTNPNCEDAIIILADIMHRRNRYDDAANHFSQLLEKKPDNYNALVEYVQLLRRAGHLHRATKTLENADKSVQPGQKPDPGYYYAKGLYQRCTNNSADALKTFNEGRYPIENKWAQRSLISMIEIFISPDNENLWEDVSTELKDEAKKNLAAAEPLLAEVQDITKRTLLEGYWYAAHKEKAFLEKALEKFFELLSSDTVDDGEEEDENATSKKPTNSTKDEGESSGKINVPALVGLAVVLQMMKQTPKARNHLKKVAKTQYNASEDSEFERGYLLLADIYIQNGKYDLAQELLKRAIQANRSCSRGWELMGLIFEKEQSYKDAADFYDKAWRLLGERDPGIGFKLAFNYLKAKKFVTAIDVCHKVLAIHPDYPKIEKDVLERARLLLRQ